MSSAAMQTCISCVCTPFIFYLKYPHVLLSPSTFQAESSVANMSRSLCVFWFIFSCATVSEVYSPKHLSFLIESQGMVPHLFPILTLGLARLPLSVQNKWLPPGANCAVLQYSHLLPALNNEINELQNIASRLQGRLQMAFLLLLMC